MEENKIDMIEELIRRYDDYVSTFKDENGMLPAMMQLKRQHTDRVVANAKLIAEGESFDEGTRELALAAALLHDTGRFEQLKRYNTFRDSDSIDHAVLSHDIVKEKGWLNSKPVLDAILYHNRRDIPEDLDVLTEILSHAVRDADKLDIFNVLEELVTTTDWRNGSKAFWNLEIMAAPNPDVMSAIMKRQPVDYQNIKSLADFVLIQVGWMISGLHFRTTHRLCRNRGHLKFRRDFLHQLTKDESIDRICDMAESQS